MKKLLGILVLGLLVCNGANSATIANCKTYHEGELAFSDSFDISPDSEWNPEYTDEYIYWVSIRPKDSTSNTGAGFYYRLSRYDGALTLRVSHKSTLKDLVKRTRHNANIDFVLYGNCSKGGKKKF